jgi:hypothetical protein
MTMALHDNIDFYGWTQAQADALRAEKWELLDVAHLAEEIESLGKRGWASRRRFDAVEL